MAVEVDLLNANSINNINTNFNRVKEALQDAVSRDGHLPNSMDSDLDLDSNDILNGGIGNFEEVIVDGVPVNQIVGADGWSPLLAVRNDGSRRVFEVVDWVGGEGPKPTELGYVGTTGLVPTIGDAVNVRGPIGPAGPGVGDMLASVYDPQSISDDAFDRANHTGTQSISTITDLDDALSDRVLEVATRTELKALSTTTNTSVFLTEVGREGLFVWRAGD
jgi:hypothetical protein